MEFLLKPANQQHEDTCFLTQREADYTTVNLIFIWFFSSISLPTFKMQLPVAVTLLVYRLGVCFSAFVGLLLFYLFNLLIEKNQ